MPEPSDSLAKRLERLEAHVRRLEDQVAIYQLLASYGPAVDSRSGEAAADLWAQDGRYDFGGPPLEGREHIGSLVDLDTHVGYVAAGCAHVISMPVVSVDGDCAVATGYSRVYLRSGDGWKVERASANRWELARTAAGWKVTNRINRPLDGAPDARGLLARGIAGNTPREH
jgi:ketosteroid isomerase-like protein